jgi:hypothetical protein
MGANNNIIICSKFYTIDNTKFDIEFLEPTQNSHDIGLAIETSLNKKVNTILIQAATSL